MGMAASQARLLSITARIHDVEYQAQQIQSRKLQLATLEDEAYRKYNDALDATTLTFSNDNGTLVPATFNNLCGRASIDNGMESKHYVFRSGDTDQLIVPNDIFEGYMKYQEEDPYVFAMNMMGVEGTELSEAESKYVNEKLKSDNDGKEPLRDIVKQIAAMFSQDEKAAATFIVDEGNYGNVDEYLRGMDIENPNYETVKELVEEFHTSEKEYRNKLYQRGAGENIYKIAMNNDNADFDKNEFQYYLRWGMLIEQEGGLDYCIQESEYGEGFGKDQEMLNGMLESGRMTVDSVEIRNGVLKDSATSVAAESRLDTPNTSTIDKKALAKAEAEYEHTMKELDRKDKRYDMDLNKLETERTALTTEYDSVKKVIQDNIDRTFKIFS